MPIDRSQYQIDLKTSADTGGVEKTIASAQEAREAFDLLRLSAANALGSIGEMIHLLEDPYLGALAGATLATRMLVQELQAARVNTSDQISQSMARPDVFQENRDQHLQQIPSPNDLDQKNEAALMAQEEDARAADQAQGHENIGADETTRLQRLGELGQQAQAGASTGENAGASAADVRGSITRTQQHISQINAEGSDREGGLARQEEVCKLIQLNDSLIGLHQNQAAQQGQLLDKIEAMMSRVQALEAAQRNTRWQSQ
jgi:hypothetical protein